MTIDQSIHTLLVESNIQEAHYIRGLIPQAPVVPFTCENVPSLGEAKDRLRHEPFDLVLLDLSLPHSYGLDTFIRLHPHALCLPIVVLIDSNDESLALQAVRPGAQHYFVKTNLESEPFVRALRHAIEQKQVETALRVRNQQLFEASPSYSLLSS